MYQSRPVHRHGRLSNVLSRRSTSRVTVWCRFRDISSLDAVAFVKKVGEAFGVEVPPEEVANWKNLRDFAAFLDSSAS